jgi:hypothetical protein
MNEIAPHKIADGWLKKFLLGGNATFTVRSLKTGTRFTFKVVQPRDTTPHFVSVMTGPDNESSYTYLGTIFNASSYRHGKRSTIEETDKRAVAATWVCTKVLAGEQLKNLEVWHEGRCGRCGRKLTVPESIESGFGPECIKHV